MKQSETKIKEIAIRVMDETGSIYDKKVGPQIIFQSLESQIKDFEFAKKLPDYDNYIVDLVSQWLVGFDFPKETGINSSWHLKISDETGEPLSLRHRQAAFKIEKSEGKYVRIDDWVRGQGDH
jgi:hypothetical protein